MRLDGQIEEAKVRGWWDYHRDLPADANPWVGHSELLAEAWDDGWARGFTATAICAWAEHFSRIRGRRPTAAEVDSMFQCGEDEAIVLLDVGLGTWTDDRHRRVALVEWISVLPEAPTVGQAALAFLVTPHEIADIARPPLLKRLHRDLPLIDQVVDISLE